MDYRRNQLGLAFASSKRSMFGICYRGRHHGFEAVWTSLYQLRYHDGMAEGSFEKVLDIISSSLELIGIESKAHVTGEFKADSEAGQVSTDGENTGGMQTNQAGYSTMMPLENIPMSGNPFLIVERAADPDGISISEVSSKRQNLAIEWDGSLSHKVDADAVASLPLSQSSTSSGKKVLRQARKNKVIKSPSRSGWRKVGIPLSKADTELVECLSSQLGLRWLALNSHGVNGNSQLECSGDGATPDILDLTRVVYSPSSLNPVGVSGGLALWWKDEVTIDVSEVGSIWEKQGGLPFNSTRLEKFQELLSDCDLMDLEFKVPAYTWTNKQGGDINVRERLDRVVANVEWRNLFPLAQVLHDILVGSDHCPLILNCCLPLKRVLYSFKFESMWCTSEECGDVIASSWNTNQRGSPQVAVVEKLKHCKEMLKPWSKRTFGNNLEKIKSLKLQLGEIQGKPYSVENFQKENQITRELEVILLREEMHQHQRSRLNWIIEGVWLLEDHDINEHLFEYFSKLFTSIGTRDFEEVLQKVDRCVTNEMNSKLTQMVSDEEIKIRRIGLGIVRNLIERSPPEVVEAILKIPLPLVDRQDQLVWHYNQKGVYSVKSGYQVAMQSNLSLRNEKPESPFKPKEVMWKVLWKMKA
ncbi:hypothetical protein RHSIM_Rhsim06G0102000 [Rhododendron simsii]|uniref:Uncharacterized protein n=1 Tax=Rhododendron simsii TaxID=118357 RepID=A0A834GZ46_RHOSS|nr:hypothetical protein RHSIM_Rhsim06G0102000 [Rhododendron simsii]